MAGYLKVDSSNKEWFPAHAVSSEANLSAAEMMMPIVEKIVRESKQLAEAKTVEKFTVMWNNVFSMEHFEENRAYLNMPEYLSNI